MPSTQTITNNLFLTSPSSWIAEIMAHAGYDSLTLDMQHGLIDYATAVSMLQAISTTEIIPFVRAKWNTPDHIMQMIDAGAKGIICPMIYTADDAQRFVEACHYPPIGIRSFGPVRAALYSKEDYFTTYQKELYTYAMIETAEALENVDAIAKVKHLTGLYVGPFDLSVSLGMPKRADFNDPELISILKKVLSCAKDNHLKAGVFTVRMEDAKKAIDLGFDFISLGVETLLLQQAAAKQLEAFSAIKP